MLQSRRAAQVLALAILAWICGSVVMVLWIAALIAGLTPSHQVDETMILVLVLGPQAFISAIGIAALVSLRRNGPWGTFLGGLWAVLETIFAMLAAGRILVLTTRVVTQGWTASWDAADAALVFSHPGGAETTYWTDIGAVGMLVIALVGLVAAALLARRPAAQGSSAVPEPRG